MAKTRFLGFCGTGTLAGENFYLYSILGATEAHVAQPPSAVVLSLIMRIVGFERNG
jgi:hypothetical protein